MHHDDGELDLIRAAKGGDQHALERLLLRHYDRLGRRIARRMPASLQVTVSEEDILQEVLVTASRELASFEPQGSWAFFRWLCAIAEFRLRDALKAHRAAKRGGGAEGPAAQPGIWVDSSRELIDLLAGPRRTPSRSVAGHEAASAIRAALEELREDHRRALQMRYVQGLPIAEIAKAMNRTPHAVHNLCYRGLQELHGKLGASSRYLTRR